ncbi:MAG: NADPH-dependent glutamate synthase [Anaerolineales bacterium]
MSTVLGGSLKIDRKERMKIPFESLHLRPPEERIHDFGDVVIPMDAERAMREASRCIHCPDPAACVEACPAHNDIPAAMWLIENGEFLEAADVYHQTSTLPAICGRVCPHEQLCQGACPRNKRGEPVLTGALEAFVIDYEHEHRPYKIPVGKPTGKQVAVVGAGPAGFAVAEKLVEKGHAVTIFDAKPAPGGLLLYGIPNFKLPKNVVWDKWHELDEAGVKFVGETYIGRDKTVEQLMAEGFEAVFLGVGSGIDAKMDKTPGTDLPGVCEATDFLIYSNVNPKYLPKSHCDNPAVGKRVVVIGGGDTASDCLRTALRMGAQDVTCLYRRTEKEMPGSVRDRELAKEEGAKYRFLTQPIRFIAGEDGRLAAVECLEMELGEPDESGRRRPVPIEGSNFTVAADTAILALGYWPDPIIGETTPSLETHKWGLIKLVDKETGATTMPGVFAGGDCVTGPAIVAEAMVAGLKAAEAIDTYLRQK